MSTLTVLIPPRDAAGTAAAGGTAGETATSGASDLSGVPPASRGLRYVLTDRRGAVLQSGHAPLGLLPKAQATCLVLAARDVLLVDAPVPPLHGARLQQALPNIIEDWLLPDTAPVHIAVGPLPGAGAAMPRRAGGRFSMRRPRLAALGKAVTVRTLAAVDRRWLQDLVTRFSEAGHRSLRIVPMTGCLPLPDAASASAARTMQDGARLPVSVLLDDAALDSAALDSGGARIDAAGTMLELTIRRQPAAGGERLDVADTAPDTLLTPAADAGLARAATSAESAVDARDVVALSAHGDGAMDGEASDAAQAQALSELSPGTRGDAEDDATEAHRLSGEGLRVAAIDVDTILDLIAPERVVYRLTGGDGPSLGGNAAGAAGLLRRGTRSYSMADVAAAAQRCAIDLCQFDFAPKGLRLSGALWRQIRWPVLLLAATVLVSIVGVNIRWLQLAHQRNAVQAAMTERLLASFPSTTVVLDPVVQMSRSLDALRVAAGELSPNDFLTLTNGLSLSMGGISPNGIATMHYDRGALEVVFRGDAAVDGGLRDRLARQGLDATVESRPDGQHWTIRSRR